MRAKLVSSRWAALLLALAVWPGARGATEPPLEKRILFGPESARQWSAAESSMEASTNRTRSGQATLHWHVAVDHFAGEPNYPIGWPRVSATFREEARDWSGWDYLEMWVFTGTSRAALPREPVGLTLHTPDRNTAVNRPLAELKKDEWVQIRIPLFQVPRHHDVRLMQVHISESQYRHQDRLDFYFDEIALLRYARPTVLDFAAENAVMFSDARQVPVRFNLAGVKPGESVDVICEFRQGAKVVTQTKVTSTRGPQRVALDLVGGKLGAGEYELAARATGGGEAATARMRLVGSPWK